VSRAIRGFSLVELMVSITIGLILTAGALSVLYTSKLTYNENERVARLQENGRAAIELMLRDMRAGGFKGCNQVTTINNTLATPTGLLWNFAEPVQGFEAGATSWSPAVDAAITSPRTGSDIFAVRTSRIDAPSFTTNASMASSTGSITVNNPAGQTLPTPATLMISDCADATVFVGTGFSTTTGISTITHANDLGVAFRAGSRVTPVDTIVYYIRDSGTVRNGVRNPSLWRIVGNNAADELVEGIEAMQVRYGVDTDNDRLVNEYRDASGVTNWGRVISVSIALLIRSLEPTSPTNESRTYSLLGTNVATPNDRYQRTLYTTTVALRNNTQ
jgi:type IV pilus assembly protein PilW